MIYIQDTNKDNIYMYVIVSGHNVWCSNCYDSDVDPATLLYGR